MKHKHIKVPQYRLLRALGLSVLFQAGLWAQVILSTHVGQWVQNRYTHHNFDANVVTILDDQGGVVEQIKLPVRENKTFLSEDGKPFQSQGPSFGRPYAWEETWHIVRHAKNPQDRRQEDIELMALEQGTWHPEVVVTLPRGVGSQVFPFGEKRYLFITGATLPKTASRKWSPFQIYRRNDKDQLTFDGVLDPELPGAVEKELRMESITFIPVLTGSHLTLISPNRGRIWSFNLAEGKLARTRDLFTLPPTRFRTAFGPLPFYPIVLNTIPGADGTLLLMTRSERAVQETLLESEQIHLQGNLFFDAGKDQRPLAEANMQKAQDRAFSNNPIMQWWNFDPATGDLKRLDSAPMGGMDILHTEKDLEAIALRPLSNGDMAPLHHVSPKPTK